MNTMRLSRSSPSFHCALVIAVEDHVHALEHEALRIVLEREMPLQRRMFGPSFCDEVLDPGKELVRSSGLSVVSDTIAYPRRDSA